MGARGYASEEREFGACMGAICTLIAIEIVAFFLLAAWVCRG